MPISRKDFEEGKAFDTDGEGVVTFFEKNRDNAYTTGEIAKALGLQTTKADAWLIHILQKLEKEGRIESKKNGDKDYWILVT
jgi:uncharacterized membrane protein